MIWLLATLILVVLAQLLGLGLLAYALYTLLAVLLISRALTFAWVGHLAAQRRTSTLTASIGEKVAVTVQVTNQGRIPVAWTLIEDLLPRHALIHHPPKLEVLGQRMRLVRIAPDETVRLLYQLRCRRRGYFQLGPLVMETGDLFGLHRRYRVASRPHFLTVYPDVVPLAGYEIASRRPIGQVRMMHRLFEDPTRQAGVRAYQAGDPLNRVHWRATARTGQLQTKILEPSSMAGATMLLDFHQQSFTDRDEPARSELAITAATSIAFALYQMGQPVGLVTNGRDAAQRIRQEGWEYDLRTRKAALAAAQGATPDERLAPLVISTARDSDTPLQIRSLLARLEKTDGLLFPQLLQECSSRISRSATALAILTQVTEQTVIALGNLHRQGFRVAAILNIYEPYDFAEAGGPLVAQRIAIHHLRDAASVPTIARRLVV
jgi:uncharacterized protein (DUF58 family)